jgi:Ca2+-binding RTX toxin-like protein
VLANIVASRSYRSQVRLDIWRRIPVENAMPVLKLFANHPDDTVPFGTFQQAKLAEHDENRAVFIDKADGDQLYILGHHFEYSHGELVSGTIRSVFLRDGEGHREALIENMRFDASGLPDIATPDWGSAAAIAMLQGDDGITGANGRDVLSGYGGADSIDGAGGDDIIRGGKGDDDLEGDFPIDSSHGSDQFIFGRHDGHDTIEDFDGGGDFQDIIEAKAESYSVHRQGHDTLIEFDTGVSVTLKDFDKADLQTANIHLI